MEGLWAGLALAALAVAGCGIKGVLRPNSAPHTIIFIQGPVDTVNHVVHMHWFGTEAGGYIAGYEVRLLNPAAPADSAWRFTTLTDSLITVLAPTGFTSAVFEARAIDDKGVKDPDPAHQVFNFRNTPPVVRIVTKPNSADRSDTTFASITIQWTVSDPDGDANKVVSRVWLNGHEDEAVVANSFTFTLPSAKFLENGVYKSGFRTLYIQGIDDGGMLGSVDSVRWYVRAPVTGARARLLLVDDLPSNDAAKFRNDTLYVHAIANAGLLAGDWSVLHLAVNQPFRSARDLEQTLDQFETVVWYHGEQTLSSKTLGSFGDGIGPYLDQGGRMLIESLALIATPNTNGALSLDFADRYLNCAGVFQFFPVPDSSAAWGLSGSGTVLFPTLSDSLVNRRIVGGMRGFLTRDASQILAVVPAHTFSQDNAIDMAVGLNVPQPHGGRMIVDTYPMVSGTAVAGQRASLVLLKIFGLLGLTGP